MPLAERLGERDVAILANLERFRLLSTRHVQRLHFTDHTTTSAAARACNRALFRLRDLRLISSLERRIGGVRQGSASYVWQLAAAGERVQRDGRGQASRRRFAEPGGSFVVHTLAVAETAVCVLEAARTSNSFAVDRLETEPANWRSYLGPAGETRWLKPDLHIVTAHPNPHGDFEEHAFVEVDLGTEHSPRIQSKCQMYAAYMATGAYQAAHGLFPLVVWLSGSPARRGGLSAAVAATRGLPAGVFHVASPEAYLQRLTGSP